MSKIINFIEKKQQKKESFIEQAIFLISKEDTEKYYNFIILPIVKDKNMYQRILIEEIFYRAIIEGFAFGLEKSRTKFHHENNRSLPLRAIEEMTITILNDYKIIKNLDEWDSLTISIMVEDVISQWYKKGYTMGKKHKNISK